MASQTEQIAASQQRQGITREWQLEFGDWANASLQSLADDFKAPSHVRIFARWELEYRKAFGILLVVHPELGVTVKVDTDAELEAIETAEARVKARAAAARERIKR